MKRIMMLVAASSAALWATVIHVPTEQPTIQAGLSAASYGDTVAVAPGLYPENIVWPATDGIYLVSDSGPEATTIDGSSARVLSFPGPYSRATWIRGFRVTGGKANAAAGIYVQSGSPSIVGNIIEGNTCAGGRDYGAGIYVETGTQPLIKGNIIRNNICSDTATWNHGAGIFVERQARPEICYNLITGNVCSKGYWNHGAGIYIDMQGDAIIYQNVIAENTCDEGDRGHGAGIYVYLYATPLIFCNVIRDNTCSSDLWNYGAGILCEAPGLIVNNTITGNSCTGGNWRAGGGIYMDSQAQVKNNIIVGNSAGSGGGIYNNRGAVTLMDYNDVWNNTGGNYYGCAPGAHDLSLDPQFVIGAHGDYYLSQIAAGQPTNSPCVNAGTGGVLPESLEGCLSIWTTRTDSVGDDSLFDMGYHYPREEYPVAVNRTEGRGARDEGIAVRAFPNPFASRVRFRCSTSGPGRLKVYAATGRLVREFTLSTGQSELDWDAADLAPGAYFYRALANFRTTTGRIVKAR